MRAVLRSCGRAAVELGCGRRRVPIANIGVDRYPFPGADIVADLEELPWRWAEKDSCSLVVCHQTLEHISDLLGVMAEIHRICDEEAFVEVVVPYGAGKPALQDPTHVRFFTEVTFRYWEPGFVESFGDYGIERYFAICRWASLEDANLWTLLKPLKTEDQLATWLRLLEESGEAHSVTWPAPDWLLKRGHGLLGSPGKGCEIVKA